MEATGQLYLTSDMNVTLDANYRYKVALPEFAFVKKKGTMNTIFVNITAFAKSIEIEPTILIKIIGKKLSTRSTLSGIQGQHDTNIIKNIIYTFIQDFLLCKSCDKPEVKLKVSSSDKTRLKQKCKACGNKTYIERDVDTDIIELLCKHIQTKN